MNKGLDLAFQIYGTLKQRADRLKNASERDLVLSICSSMAVIISTIISVGFYIGFGAKAAVVSFLLVSPLLTSVSLLIGVYVWELIPLLWLKTGNTSFYLKYLDYEYNRDIERIDKLPMADPKKAPLLLERYKKYLDDTNRVKERILPLTRSDTRNSPHS
jgi:hypothetical protein